MSCWKVLSTHHPFPSSGSSPFCAFFWGVPPRLEVGVIDASLMTGHSTVINFVCFNQLSVSAVATQFWLLMLTTALFCGCKHNYVEDDLTDTSCRFNKTTAVANPHDLWPPQSCTFHQMWILSCHAGIRSDQKAVWYPIPCAIYARTYSPMPLLHQRAHLVQLVGFNTVYDWVRQFSPSSLCSISHQYENYPTRRKLQTQFQLDISLSRDQGMWCVQQ